MKKIGYTIFAGGETRTVVLDEVYPDAEAEKAIRRANSVERGPNIKGAISWTYTVWSTFPLEATL